MLATGRSCLRLVARPPRRHRVRVVALMPGLYTSVTESEGLTSPLTRLRRRPQVRGIHVEQ
jgi:hypothetical protein